MNNTLVCRCCFATDVRLYLLENQLLTAYQNIVGTQVTLTGLQYVCYLCGTLLLKYMKFREQCVSAEQLLQNVLDENVIYAIKHFSNSETFMHQLKLIKTKTLYIEYNPVISIDSDESTSDSPEAYYVFKTGIDNNLKKINASNAITSKLNYKAESNDDNPMDGDESDDFESDVNVKFNKRYDSNPIYSNEKVNTNFVYIENESDDAILNTNPVIVKTTKNTLVLEPLKVEERRNRTRVDIRKKGNVEAENDDTLPGAICGRANFENTYNVKIIELSIEEQIHEVKSRMKTDHYFDSKYKCIMCYRGFQYEQGYKKHLATYHNEVNAENKCDICNLHYSNRKSLEAHKLRHRFKFVCKKCGFVSRHSNRAIRHDKFHQGHTYVCQYCDKSFDISSTYFSHVRLLHPERLTSCHICGESFIGQHGVRNHCGRKHPETVLFKCNRCNLRFQTNEAVLKHKSLQTDNTNCAVDVCPCNHCGEHFANKELMAKHLIEAHSKDFEMFPCEKCSQVFLTETGRSVHMKLMHSNTFSDPKCKDSAEFKCYECEKVFSSSNQLRYHQRLHINCPELVAEELQCSKSESNSPEANAPRTRKKRKYTRKYMCEICGLHKFPSPATLIYHQRIHTGEKPFSCDVCHKAYAVRYKLLRHSIVHKGVKPYKCKECDKAFYTLFNLQRHEQTTHTDERHRYSCEVCNKTFTQKGSAKQHIQYVHMKMPYKPKIRHRAKEAQT